MVLGESHDIGDGFFMTVIVINDELQFDTHTGASPGSSDRCIAQAILPDFHGFPQHLPALLLPVLLAALRALGDAPARSLTALAQQLGVAEDDAASGVDSREEEPAPVAAPASPLLPMTGPNDASSAPKTLLNRRGVIAARKRTTRSKMSCS